jgi:hypothetical protein
MFQTTEEKPTEGTNPETKHTPETPTEPKSEKLPPPVKPKPEKKASPARPKSVIAKKPPKKAVKANKAGKTKGVKSDATVIRFSSTHSILSQLHGATKRIGLGSLSTLLRTSIVEFLRRNGESKVAVALAASDTRGLEGAQEKPKGKSAAKKA